jgi:hypothetical protein
MFICAIILKIIYLHPLFQCPKYWEIAHTLFMTGIYISEISKFSQFYMFLEFQIISSYTHFWNLIFSKKTKKSKCKKFEKNLWWPFTVKYLWIFLRILIYCKIVHFLLSKMLLYTCLIPFCTTFLNWHKLFFEILVSHHRLFWMEADLLRRRPFRQVFCLGHHVI